MHVERPLASANCPFGQNEHVALPNAAWNLPAGQSAHSLTADFTSACLKRPGGHCEHSVAPLMSVYLPLPHTTQSVFSRAAMKTSKSIMAALMAAFQRQGRTRVENRGASREHRFNPSLAEPLQLWCVPCLIKRAARLHDSTSLSIVATPFRCSLVTRAQLSFSLSILVSDVTC